MLNQTGPGTPAPRCSRRESPINRGSRYLGGGNGVKAILALLTLGHAEYRGEGARTTAYGSPLFKGDALPAVQLLQGTLDGRPRLAIQEQL